MKKYEAPEAIVVEFDDVDLLKLSPADEGDAGELDW